MPTGRQHVLQAEPLREDQQIVEVVAGASEVLGADRGLEAQRVDRGEHAVPLAVPTRREPVVEREADPHLDEAARRVTVDRHQERERPNQVRRQPIEGLALPQGLAHETDVEQLEVPEAAVDQLR